MRLQLRQKTDWSPVLPTVDKIFRLNLRNNCDKNAFVTSDQPIFTEQRVLKKFGPFSALSFTNLGIIHPPGFPAP
jgi:hypothetical protein